MGKGGGDPTQGKNLLNAFLHHSEPPTKESKSMMGRT